MNGERRAPAPETREGVPFISASDLLVHWQGHRRLTRRVIEAFPDDDLFTFSVGGMRPFGALAQELLRMAAPTVRGLVDDVWEGAARGGPPATKEALLEAWDAATAEMDALWPRVPADRFAATLLAFGQYEGPGRDIVLYVIDNEIHHRAQGYVYLRALGIEPPPFWERDEARVAGG